MAGELAQVRRGLSACLEKIDGLRVVGYPPTDWRDFPLAIIGPARVVVSNICLAGSSFEAECVVTVAVESIDRAGAYADIESYIDPQADRSIQAAIERDGSLGGSVDDAFLVGRVSVAERRIGDSACVAADFTVRFLVQIV